MTYSRISVEPLTPLIGAEIGGVQLVDCGQQAFEEIGRAWAEHLVLFFRDQELSVQQHKAFASRLGELHLHPSTKTVEGHPDVMIVHADYPQERSGFRVSVVGEIPV